MSDALAKGGLAFLDFGGLLRAKGGATFLVRHGVQTGRRDQCCSVGPIGARPIAAAACAAIQCG